MVWQHVLVAQHGSQPNSQSTVAVLLFCATTQKTELSLINMPTHKQVQPPMSPMPYGYYPLPYHFLPPYYPMQA